MTREEVVVFLASCRAAFPGMTLVAGMGTKWEQMLRDVSLDEAELALTAYGRVEERPPAAASIRAYVRAAREAQAQATAAQRALASDGRRHRMPAGFRELAAQWAAANRGKYAELHEAIREKEREQGRELRPYKPMPGFLSRELAGSRRDTDERAPQDRAAGPDS